MNDLLKIISRDNQRLAHARKVRDGYSKATMFIEGKRLTLEALRSGLGISACFVAERFANSSQNAEILGRLAASAQAIYELSDSLFRTVAATENSQGVIVMAERPATSLKRIEENLDSKGTLPIVLLLLRVNNPSNLGAILRTAEAAGVAGVIISNGSTDVFSPKAIRASMGAAFRVPIRAGADFESVITWADKLQLRATVIGTASRNSYSNADLRIPRLLIFGSEAHGIDILELNKVNEALSIPMENEVESLNLGVAAAIILFEAKRQFNKN